MIHYFKTSDSYVSNQLKEYKKPLINTYILSSIATLIFSVIFQSVIAFILIALYTLIIYYHYIKFKRNLLKSDRVKSGMFAQVDTSTHTLTLDCGEDRFSIKLLEVKNISIDKLSHFVIETDRNERVVIGGYENQKKLNSLLNQYKTQKKS